MERRKRISIPALGQCLRLWISHTFPRVECDYDQTVIRLRRGNPRGVTNALRGRGYGSEELLKHRHRSSA